MTRNDNYSGDGAVAMVLALGHTVYLVHIETASVLVRSHPTPYPDNSAPGTFRSGRSDLHYAGCDRERESTSEGLPNGPALPVQSKPTASTITMETKSGTP